MRVTRSHTGNRRSHHGVKAPRLSKDIKTGSTHLRHRADVRTGMYRGQKIIDVETLKAKKTLRAEKKLKSRGLDPSETAKDLATETKESSE